MQLLPKLRIFPAILLLAALVSMVWHESLLGIDFQPSAPFSIVEIDGVGSGDEHIVQPALPLGQFLVTLEPACLETLEDFESGDFDEPQRFQFLTRGPPLRGASLGAYRA